MRVPLRDIRLRNRAAALGSGKSFAFFAVLIFMVSAAGLALADEHVIIGCSILFALVSGVTLLYGNFHSDGEHEIFEEWESFYRKLAVAFYDDSGRLGDSMYANQYVERFNHASQAIQNHRSNDDVVAAVDSAYAARLEWLKEVRR